MFSPGTTGENFFYIGFLLSEISIEEDATRGYFTTTALPELLQGELLCLHGAKKQRRVTVATTAWRDFYRAACNADAVL